MVISVGRLRAWLAVAFLICATASAAAQSSDEREAWKAQVAAAKARAAQLRKEAIDETRRLKEEALRNPAPYAGRERINSDAVLNDMSLQRGDIVSTVDGFFLFIGRGDTRNADDFVRLPIQPSHR